MGLERINRQDVNGEKYFSLSEVAELLFVKPDTVRKYIRTGKLDGIKVFKGYVISETALVHFFDGLKQ